MRLLHRLYAAVFSDRYSHFCFVLHFYELGGSKFNHVVGFPKFPAVVLPIEDKKCDKNTYSRFSPGK